MWFSEKVGYWMIKMIRVEIIMLHFINSVKFIIDHLHDVLYKRTIQGILINYYA